MDSVAFAHQDRPGMDIVSFAFAFGKKVPQGVEPHGAGEVLFDLSKLQSRGETIDVFRPLTAHVGLSTGETFSSEAVTLMVKGPDDRAELDP